MLSRRAWYGMTEGAIGSLLGSVGIVELLERYCYWVCRLLQGCVGTCSRALCRPAGAGRAAGGSSLTVRRQM